MFIRIRQWATQPGEWDRFVGRLQHEGLQAMQASEGFQRLVVMGDPMSNLVITITYWESEAKERIYEGEKAHAFAKLVKDLVTGAPETLAYPVVMDLSA